MQHSIEYGPSFSWLRVRLGANETLTAEAGAMVTRDVHVDMATRLNAGNKAGFFGKLLAVLAAVVRKFVGGETMFINDFSSSQGGEVVIAPALTGAIEHYALAGDRTLLVQAGSYLASSPGVDTKLRWGGIRTLLGGEGATLMECSGRGDLFINSYGGIEAIQVDGSYVLDTGHMVAFEGNLDFKLRKAGSGWKSFFFSGEGLVMEFNGKGTLYIQSRNIGALTNWLTPLLR